MDHPLDFEQLDETFDGIQAFPEARCHHGGPSPRPYKGCNDGSITLTPRRNKIVEKKSRKVGQPCLRTGVLPKVLLTVKS